MLSPAALLPAITALAQEAGEQILKIYDGTDDGEVEVWHKHDESPLTAADLCAHRILVDALARLTPELPILSEEGASVPFSERRRWTRYWLVDPLDGTREFVKRNGEFTVNIALIDHGRPVLGVVHAPALATTYFAAAGAGSWKVCGTEAATRLRTAATGPAPRIVASRSHATRELSTLLARLPNHRVVQVGSSLKFGLVAEGGADFYPRLGPTSEWDTAAGQCIVEQAGGVVTHVDGSPLRYNTKSSLLNPSFLVAGQADFPWHEFVPR